MCLSLSQVRCRVPTGWCDRVVLDVKLEIAESDQAIERLHHLSTAVEVLPAELSAPSLAKRLIAVDDLVGLGRSGQQHVAASR